MRDLFSISFCFLSLLLFLVLPILASFFGSPFRPAFSSFLSSTDSLSFRFFFFSSSFFYRL